MGYGEGGLLALYSSAIDQRIEVTLVSGYFQPREEVWKEPIYRDVWGLLNEFGDAELASLIAPRALIVESSRGPETREMLPEWDELRGAQGRLASPTLDSVEREVNRARAFFDALNAGSQLQLVASQEGHGLPGSEVALRAFLKALGVTEFQRAGDPPSDLRKDYDPRTRLKDQFHQLIEYTQKLVIQSPERRAEFWSNADDSSPERWKKTTQFYRDYIWKEVIGQLPPPGLPPNSSVTFFL